MSHLRPISPTHCIIWPLWQRHHKTPPQVHRPFVCGLEGAEPSHRASTQHPAQANVCGFCETLRPHKGWEGKCKACSGLPCLLVPLCHAFGAGARGPGGATELAEATAGSVPAPQAAVTGTSSAEGGTTEKPYTLCAIKRFSLIILISMLIDTRTPFSVLSLSTSSLSLLF